MRAILRSNSKEGDLLLLIAGQFISMLGNEMQNFALSLYVLDITKSATRFASVLAMTFIPRIILGPIAGVFIDWLDKKKVIIILDIASFIVVLTFGIMYCTEMGKGLQMYQIYILVILLNGILLIYTPSVSAIVPLIVREENLMRAISINTMSENSAMLLAPILAGIVLAVWHFGLLIIFIVNAVSFLFAATMEFYCAIPHTGKPRTAIPSFKADFLEGLMFLKNKKKLFYIQFFAVIYNFVSASFAVGVTFIVKETLHANDILFGLFQSSLAIALLLGSLVSAIVSKKVAVGSLMFFAALNSAVLIELIALFSSNMYLRLFKIMLIPFITIMMVSFLRRVISSVGAIALNTAIQKEIPAPVMGRVLTLTGTLSMCSVPAGQLISGIMLDKMPAWACFTPMFGLLFVTTLMLKSTLYSFNLNSRDASNSYNS